MVTTQCVEAGVDINASLLFTQLSPADSWVQRIGRLDRAGEVGDSICFVIGFDCRDEQLLPYSRKELIAADHFIRALDGNGAIANIEKYPIPYPENKSEPLTKEILRGLFVTDRKYWISECKKIH